MRLWLLLFVALLLASRADAFVPRLSVATGNVTDATLTWATVDNTSSTGTSWLDSEAGNTAVGTSYTSNCTAAIQWASGAPVVDAIGVKIASRETTPSTHTVTICLNDNSSGTHCSAANNTGREVTLNVSDLDNLQSLNQGFLVAKLASSMTPATATSYYVCVKTSNASSVNHSTRMCRPCCHGSHPDVGANVHKRQVGSHFPWVISHACSVLQA